MRSAWMTAVILALCGCASGGTKIDASQLSEVRKGQTTVSEIVKKFGRPNVLSKNWDGTQTVAYSNADGGSAAANLLPAMGALVGGGRDAVVFYFDANGVLTDYKATQASAASAPQPNTSTSAPAQNAAESPAQNKVVSPEPARASPARKSGDGFPSWLPSEVRDVRQ